MNFDKLRFTKRGMRTLSISPGTAAEKRSVVSDKEMFCDALLRRENAVLNDTQRLKRYLAEEMVEEYEEGRMSRRQMIKTVGRILGVAVVSPTLLASLGCGSPEAGDEGKETALGPARGTSGVPKKPKN